MPPHTEDTSSDDGEQDRSKLGVLVPELVQKDNRALVKYLHDGSKRNRLGPETTNRLTHALAMFFWANPDELKSAAYSKHTDVDPEPFMERINQYQEKHRDETQEAMKHLFERSPQHESDYPDETQQEMKQLAEKKAQLREKMERLHEKHEKLDQIIEQAAGTTSSSDYLTQTERPDIPVSNEPPKQQTDQTENQSRQRQKPEELIEHAPDIPEDTPMMGDAPQNNAVPQDARRKAADLAEEKIEEVANRAEKQFESRVEKIATESAKEAIREEVQAFEQRFESILDEKLDDSGTEASNQ